MDCRGVVIPQNGNTSYPLSVGLGTNERTNMILNGLVISDVPDSYTSKKGTVVDTQILTLVDQDKTGHRLVQSVDFVISGDEKKLYAGKLQDKRVDLSIKEVTFFGGRPRLRGEIIAIDGKPVNGKPQS